MDCVYSLEKTAFIGSSVTFEIVMATTRSVEENDRVKLANIYSDTNHDARFESMRKNTRSARVLRRHEDLRKQCEKEVRTYERWQKLAAAELRQTQSMYMDRLRKFQRSLAQPAFHFSKGNVANLAPSPREVSSANSVPHYVRCRGSPRPRNTDHDLPDIGTSNIHRSYSSVGTHSGEEPLSESLKHSPRVLQSGSTSLNDAANLSPRSESKPRTVSGLSLSIPGVESVFDRLQMSPSGISGQSRGKMIKHEYSSKSPRVAILSAASTPRSTTSLPNMMSRALSGNANTAGSRTDETKPVEFVEIQEFCPPNGQLLFSVRKQNGEETYIRNKKKTVSFFV